MVTRFAGATAASVVSAAGLGWPEASLLSFAAAFFAYMRATSSSPIT
jgi:hypothetical protein